MIACQTAGSVLGKKTAMIVHLLGGQRACQYACKDAKKKAQALRDESKGQKSGTKQTGDDELEENSSGPWKRQAVEHVESVQSMLKIFQGIKVPFTESEMKLVHEQFL